MRTKNILKSLLMSAALLLSGAMVSCEKDKDGNPADFDAQIKATAQYSAVDFGETFYIDVVCNTDWRVEATKNEILIDDFNVAAQTGNQRITVTIVAADSEELEDDSYDPTQPLEFLFEADGYINGLMYTRKATVSVRVGGEAPGDVQHEGTVEDPFSPENANALCSTLANNETTEQSYFIKGIVTSIKEAYTSQYGNGTFYIGSTADASETFYVYRAYYLDNKKFTDNDTNISVGDEVVIYGKLTNYNGTYETAQNASYLYSLNGVGGGEIEQPDIKDSADVTLPYTLDTTGSLQGSNNAYASNCDVTVSEITWNFEGNTQINPWRLGGKNLDGVNRTVYTKTAMNADVKAIELTHGNYTVASVNSLTVIVAKDKEFTNVVSTLNPAFEANTTTTIEKPADADWNGCYYKFIYNVTTSGDSNQYVQFSKVVFTDGNGGGTTEPEPTPDYAHKGTADDPFTVADAIAKAKETGTTATSELYYITGTISAIKYTFSAQYGTATFDMVDAGSSDIFTAYAVKYFNNAAWVEGNTQVEVGDKVTVCGKIINYSGNTPETAQGSGYLIELNGEKGENGGTTDPGTGTDPEKPAPGTGGVDVLNVSFIGASSATSYFDWSGKTGNSGAVYAGNSADNKGSYIQLRSTNNAGIITTATGGTVKKVVVTWNSSTSNTGNRTLDVYCNNTAYSSAADLYSTATQGTKVGSITCGTDTELEIDGDYAYIGLRSNNGAMYLDDITITWE